MAFGPRPAEPRLHCLSPNRALPKAVAARRGHLRLPAPHLSSTLQVDLGAGVMCVYVYMIRTCTDIYLSIHLFTYLSTCGYIHLHICICTHICPSRSWGRDGRDGMQHYTIFRVRIIASNLKALSSNSTLPNPIRAGRRPTKEHFLGSRQLHRMLHFGYAGPTWLQAELSRRYLKRIESEAREELPNSTSVSSMNLI